MSSILEEFDFDINLLQENSNNVALETRNETLIEDVSIVKNKIVSWDTAFDQIVKSKRKMEEAKKKLSASIQENKQICIDYNKALEKIRKLEKDAEISHQHIMELQGRLDLSQNQYKAMQSHANQLQQLVHDFETQIESLKIENQRAKLNTKEQPKRTQSQKIEYETLLNDLCLIRDLWFGKIKMRSHHLIVLKKYDKFKSKTDTDDSASECSIVYIDDVFNGSNPSTDLVPKTRKKQVLQLFDASESEKNLINDDISIKTIDADHDSDSNNEVISEDTGRGSSLACSDIDKCLNSPDYFINNSPPNNTMMKDKKNYTDMSTSPITVQIERSEACTSPVSFSDIVHGPNVGKTQKQTTDIGITVHPNDFIVNRNVATSPIKTKVRERATSPLNTIQLDRATSPIQKNRLEKVVSPVLENQQESISSMKQTQEKRTSHVQFDELSSNTQTSANEKVHIEINDSTLLDTQEGDCEVENILKSVRLDYDLITPIPNSPAKVQKNDDIHSSKGYVCLDAAKLALEIEKLRAEFGALTNYVFAKEPILNDGKMCHTTKNFNDNDVLLNDNENYVSETRENCKTVEDPVKNSAIESNLINSINTPNLVVSSEIDKVQNGDQMNTNKSKDKIITQEYIIKSPIKVINKIKKTKKLTRLEKLRKKLLPRSKIRRALTPPIRKINRRNQIVFKKRILEHSSIPVKNNKLAYEKAVKVMAELKAKEKNKPEISAPCKVAVNNDFRKEVQIVLSKCDELIAQNKNINNVKAKHIPAPIVKSSVNQATSIDSVSDVKNNTTKEPVDIIPIMDNFTFTLVSPDSITTRSRSRRLSSTASNNSNISHKTMTEKGDSNISEVESCKRPKRIASDKIESAPKRMFRSSISISSNENHSEESVDISLNNTMPEPFQYRKSNKLSTPQKNESHIDKDFTRSDTDDVVTYNDLDIFSEKIPEHHKRRKSTSGKLSHPKKSILCIMLEKFAKTTVKWKARKYPDTTVDSVVKKLEEGIAHINSVPPNNVKEAMMDLLKEIRKWNIKVFMAGLMKYLENPMRRIELQNKISIPYAPPMTKSEQVLLYIVTQLQFAWPSKDLVDYLLLKIQYTLFNLSDNHTTKSSFEMVESMSHLYALLCRYTRQCRRLRIFMSDAMYCKQFKSVAIIKQCLEVWMHILPLAHMRQAKSPIVICFVYLLHFYKCEDKFNRVQEIRSILNRKYFYQVSEWTETYILEMVENAIKELRDDPHEKRLVREAIIVLGKRRGPQWCQKNIINNILQPLIKQDNVRVETKAFCVSLLGPLMKPFPINMNSLREVCSDQLLAMLDLHVSSAMDEAIISSLVYMKQYEKVNKALLAAREPGRITGQFETFLRDYVTGIEANKWKKAISNIPRT